MKQTASANVQLQSLLVGDFDGFLEAQKTTRLSQ